MLSARVALVLLLFPTICHTQAQRRLLVKTGQALEAENHGEAVHPLLLQGVDIGEMASTGHRRKAHVNVAASVQSPKQAGTGLKLMEEPAPSRISSLLHGWKLELAADSTASRLMKLAMAGARAAVANVEPSLLAASNVDEKAPKKAKEAKVPEEAVADSAPGAMAFFANAKKTEDSDRKKPSPSLSQLDATAATLSKSELARKSTAEILAEESRREAAAAAAAAEAERWQKLEEMDEAMDTARELNRASQAW